MLKVGKNGCSLCNGWDGDGEVVKVDVGYVAGSHRLAIWNTNCNTCCSCLFVIIRGVIAEAMVRASGVKYSKVRAR